MTYVRGVPSADAMEALGTTLTRLQLVNDVVCYGTLGNAEDFHTWDEADMPFAVGVRTLNDGWKWYE